VGVTRVELRLERAGQFLGYRGAALSLPRNWRAWNAYQADRLVGSLALALGPAGAFDWNEANYEGPFFAPGARPKQWSPDTQLARLECVYIAPCLRGGELWRRYLAILEGLRLPVYAAFANPRLRTRFHASHAHQPHPTNVQPPRPAHSPPRGPGKRAVLKLVSLAEGRSVTGSHRDPATLPLLTLRSASAAASYLREL
jgi:hypothetical protein